MSNLKLTTDDDLDFSTGNLVFIDGAEEIAQKIKVRLRFFFGEWLHDTRLGADHCGITFRKGVSEIERRQLFLSIVAGTPGVKEVLDFAFVFTSATRSLAVSFRAIVAGSDEPADFDQEFIIA